MSKTTWGDIAKGDAVELNGKTYTVAKLKRDGKRVKVTVAGAGGEHRAEVKAKDPVKRAKVKAEPLHDGAGRQRRWAKKSEAKKVGGELPKGDATVVEPPAPPVGDPWETPRDKVERKLVDLLEARLVAETPDEAAGYYVPPVDVTTVAAHLLLMHGAQPSDYDSDLARLAAHEQAHEEALTGEHPLAVNHWHTKSRPGVSD